LECKERLERCDAERRRMEDALAGLRGSEEAFDVAMRECLRDVEEACEEAEDAVCGVLRKVEQVSELVLRVWLWVRAEAVFSRVLDRS